MFKNQIAVIAILLCCVINYGFSQTSVWQVTKKRDTMYLGGTVHVLRQQDYPLPEAFLSAYDQSDFVGFEVDLASTESPEMMQIAMNQGMYQDGTTLKDHISDKNYALMMAMADSLNFPEAGLQKMKPTMAVLALSLMKMRTEVSDITIGVDQYFHGKAKRDSLPQLALETIQQQMDMLLSMGDAHPDQFIEYSLQEMEHTEKMLDEMIASWRTGDGAYMNGLIDSITSAYPPLYQKMLVERNQNWLPKLKNQIKQEGIAFYLMGALHLWGKDGVLQLLRDEGFKVVQM